MPPNGPDEQNGKKSPRKSTFDGLSAPNIVSGAGWTIGTEGLDLDLDLNSHPFSIDSIDRYDIGTIVGRGGMGVVYRAWDRRLQREVALKEVATDDQTRQEATRRLATEAWITAQLDHPTIVPVYSAGKTREGSLYYTMRLIKGESLSQALSNRATTSERLGLLRHFLDVCEAMAYAHSAGVIHRDLKPANIMVGPFGETQLMDWGLATTVHLGDSTPPREPRKSASSQLRAPQLSNSTRLGAVLGTPSYMSPEQARGERADKRSDVWSLGAILFELLTGESPTAGQAPEAIGAELGRQAARMSTTDDPIPPELLAITLRALAPLPNSRYPSAKDMAKDIGQFLDGKRVDAYEYTTLELFQRLVNQWRAPLYVAAGAIAIIFLVLSIALERTTEQRNRALAAQKEAVAAREDANARSASLLLKNGMSELDEKNRPNAEVLLAHALKLGADPAKVRGYLASFSAQPHPKHISSSPLPPCRDPLLSEDTSRLACRTPDGLVMYDVQTGNVLWEHNAAIDAFTFIPNTLDMLLLNNEHELMRVEANSGQSLWRHHYFRTRFDQLQLSPDGKSVLLYVGVLTVVDLETGKKRYKGRPCAPGPDTLMANFLADGTVAFICETPSTLGIFHPDTPEDIAWHPITATAFLNCSNIFTSQHDPSELILTTHDGMIGHYSLMDKRIVAQLPYSTRSIMHVVPIPNTPIILLSDSARKGASLYNTQSRQLVGQMPSHGQDRYFWSSSAQVLHSYDRTLRSWSIPANLTRHDFFHGQGISSASISPDGTTLVTTQHQGLTLWRTDKSAQPEYVPLSANMIKDVAFHKDSHEIIPTTPPLQALPRLTMADLSHASAPVDRGAKRIVGLLDGFLSADYDGLHLIWSDHGDSDLHSAYPNSGALSTFSDLAGSFSRERAVSLTGSGDVEHITPLILADGQRVLRRTNLGRFSGTRAVDVYNNRKAVMLGYDDRLVTLTPGSSEETVIPLDLNGEIVDVAISPDDTLAAVGTATEGILVYSIESGELLATMVLDGDRVSTVEFSATHDWLITSGWDGYARIWGLESLHAPVETLVATMEQRWDLTLDTVWQDRSLAQPSTR